MTTTKTKKAKKTAAADVKVVSVKTKHITLAAIVANTAQSRGMGVLTNLQDMGYGLFEKASMDKEALWELLHSDKPEDKAHACMLLEESEPELIQLATSRHKTGGLEPVGVWEQEGQVYDVIYGMRRCLADAYNNAKHGKSDLIEAKVFTFEDQPPLTQLKVLALTENLNRKDESPIDRALTYRDLRKEGLTDQQIGDRTQQSGMNVGKYMKLLHPLLKDQRMRIHTGDLKIDPAIKLLERLQKGESSEAQETREKQRIRLPSVKVIGRILTENKFPRDFDKKLREWFKDDTIRAFLGYIARVKPKPYVETPLDKPGPKPTTNGESAPTGKTLRVRRKKAQALLISLGKTTAGSWSDDILKEKLENMPNILEEGQRAETEPLQKLLDKLVAGYATGLQVEVVDD